MKSVPGLFISSRGPSNPSNIRTSWFDVMWAFCFTTFLVFTTKIFATWPTWHFRRLETKQRKLKRPWIVILRMASNIRRQVGLLIENIEWFHLVFVFWCVLQNKLNKTSSALVRILVFQMKCCFCSSHIMACLPRHCFRQAPRWPQSPGARICARQCWSSLGWCTFG